MVTLPTLPTCCQQDRKPSQKGDRESPQPHPPLLGTEVVVVRLSRTAVGLRVQGVAFEPAADLLAALAGNPGSGGDRTGHAIQVLAADDQPLRQNHRQRPLPANSCRVLPHRLQRPFDRLPLPANLSAHFGKAARARPQEQQLPVARVFLEGTAPGCRPAGTARSFHSAAGPQMGGGRMLAVFESHAQRGARVSGFVHLGPSGDEEIEHPGGSPRCRRHVQRLSAKAERVGEGLNAAPRRISQRAAGSAPPRIAR